MQSSHCNKAGILLLVMNLLFATLPSTCYAALIGTGDMLAAETRGQQMSELRSALSRDEVRARLLELGVNPQDVEQRLQGLTDAELTRLATEIKQLPAGAGVIEVVGVVFVVLLILELLDVTDVFTGL